MRASDRRCITVLVLLVSPLGLGFAAPTAKDRTCVVPSSVMETTLMRPAPCFPPDVVRLKLFDAKGAGPARGDICVFRAPRAVWKTEAEFVQRVIGVPGDSIQIVPPRLELGDKVILNLTT